LKCPLPGCNFESQAETKEELMTSGVEHAKSHGVSSPNPALMTRIEAAIQKI